MYYIVYYLQVITPRKVCFPCIQPKKAHFKNPVCCWVCIYYGYGVSGPRPALQKRTKHEQNVIVMITEREQKYSLDVGPYNIG